MYILVPIIILNAILNNKDFVNTYRLTIGGTPINVFDILLFVGLLLAFFHRNRRFPTDQVHPLFFATIATLFAALLTGLLGSIIYQEYEARTLISSIRNFLVIPLSAVLGYFMLNYPRGGKSYAFWSVVAGVGASLMTFLFFRGRGELVTTEKFDINSLRTVEYGVGCAGIAGAYLIYTMFSGIRQFPTMLAVAMCGFCILGQCATLSRSDWLALLMCILMIYFLIPKDSARLMKFVRLILVVPLLALFLAFGLYLGGKVTGVDFQRRIEQRLETLLPSERTEKTVKAWDSRVQGTFREVELFIRSPLIGRGFGHKYVFMETGEIAIGYGHNSFTHEAYSTGILGLTGCVMMLVGMWIVGRRMVLTGVDKTFVFIGAVGAITAVWFVAHGMMTASFNTPRPALTMGLTFGAVLRARMMQLAVLRQMQEEQAMWESGAYLNYESEQLQVNEPVFGNWY